MILVTSPGDWASTYSQLRHADWNGWTAADMVFPVFLFSVGAALGFSFPRPLGDADAQRGQLSPVRGIPRMHASQSNASPLASAQSEQFCGNAARSALAHAAATCAPMRRQRIRALSNSAVPAFDSMR